MITKLNVYNYYVEQVDLNLNLLFHLFQLILYLQIGVLYYTANVVILVKIILFAMPVRLYAKPMLIGELCVLGILN